MKTLKQKPKVKFKKPKSTYKSKYVDYDTFTFLEQPEIVKKVVVKKKYTKGVSIIEARFENYLKKYNIVYEVQKKIEGCVNPKTGAKLIFDFYIPSCNTLIEYDGKQHFKSIKINGVKTDLVSQKYRDDIKNKFCELNGITLIRLNKNHIDGFDAFIFRTFKNNE